MDRNLNSSEEQKPEPTKRFVLTRDIMVVDEHGNFGVIRAGVLPDARVQYTDQNGNVVWEESLWG